MSKQFTYDIAAALADNEVGRDEKDDLLKVINEDPNLLYEYNVQKFVKKLIQEKCSIINIPSETKSSIDKNIRKEIRKNSIYKKFYSQPVFRYGAAAVLLIALILIFFNRTPQIAQSEFALEQQGSDNMFVQARNNFQSILDGKLKPQIASQSSEEIQKYFLNNGVKYQTIVPEYSSWELVGAVISEDNGEKFAHHVYSHDSELVYLFQVDEKFIRENKINLSDDFVQYLDNGNCYSYKEGTNIILFTKAKNNIIGVVSNADAEKLINNFCSIN